MSNMIINGMDKKRARLIITYGLSEFQIKENIANALYYTANYLQEEIEKIRRLIFTKDKVESRLK